MLQEGGSSKKYVFLAVSLACFATPFMVSAINVAAPSIGAEFNLGSVSLNWVVTAYLIATAAFLLPAGRAVDLYGRKRIFRIGIIVYTVFSLSCGGAPSGTFLIASRFFQGIGAALIFATSLAMLSEAYPQNERGRVFGLSVAITYFGLSVGPAIGGFIVHQAGWRYVFLFNVLLGVITLAIAHYRIGRDAVPERGVPFDLPGAALYVCGLMAFLYGASGLKEVFPRGVFAGGAVLLLLFFAAERHSAHPLLDFSIFNNLTFTFSNLAALINYSATFAVGLLLSYYLQTARNLNPQDAGLILLAQPLTMAFVSPMAGRLSDRVEPRLLASLGMALTSAALAAYVGIQANTPLVLVVLVQLLMGVGFGLFSSPNTNAIMGSVDKDAYGIASATVATARMVGQAVSMAMVSLAFAFYTGNALLGPGTVAILIHTLHVCFFTFAALCCVGIVLSLARGSLHGTK